MFLGTQVIARLRDRIHLTLHAVKAAIKTALFSKVHKNELKAALLPVHPSNRREGDRHWSNRNRDVDKQLAKIPWCDGSLALDSAPVQR